MAVLKLGDDDEEKEIAFELAYLATLTTRQRFQMMFAKRDELLALLKKSNANRRTTQIIKRKPHE